MAVAAITAKERQRASINQLGLWLFFLSESFLFAALATGRFYIDGLNRPEELSQVLGLGITSILLLSSLTAYRAETAIAHGDRTAFSRFLLATIVLGVVFVAGVGVEWTIAEFDPSDPFGTAFFTMTGVHAMHVISGIVMLVLVYFLSRRGHFSPEKHWGVEGTVKYWHFVDIAWVFFYPILYLISW